MKIIKLSKKKIIKIQINKPPYLFVDSSEVRPFKSSIGKKKFNLKDFIFKLHWPKNPNLPAAFHLECMTQTASLAILVEDSVRDKYCYITKVELLNLKKKIIPPISIKIFTDILKYNHGIAYCSGEIRDDKNHNIYSNSRFTLVLPSAIKSFNLNK